MLRPGSTTSKSDNRSTSVDPPVVRRPSRVGTRPTRHLGHWEWRRRRPKTIGHDPCGHGRVGPPRSIVAERHRRGVRALTYRPYVVCGRMFRVHSSKTLIRLRTSTPRESAASTVQDYPFGPEASDSGKGSEWSLEGSHRKGTGPSVKVWLRCEITCPLIREPGVDGPDTHPRLPRGDPR